MDTLEQFQKLRNSLVQERQRLESRLKEIDRVLGGGNPSVLSAKVGAGMSDAAKAKISAAAKARWAKIKAGNKKTVIPMPKRTMSAATKKRISEAAKARWAKVKAAGRKKL